MRHGLRSRDLVATTHAYPPTYGYGPWDAAISDLRERLQHGPSARAIAALTAARRGWLELRDRLG